MTIFLIEVAAWSTGIIVWCVICVVGWYVTTRGDYSKLCPRLLHNTGMHCKNSKPCDILRYKAAVDRKAAISRSVAVFGLWPQWDCRF